MVTVISDNYVDRKELKPFYLRLRKLGFKRTNPNDREVLQYVKEYPDDECIVDVQLWIDGGHRASHEHRHIYFFKGLWHYSDSLYGQQDTIPTDFTTLEGMEEAIEYERTRFKKSDKYRLYQKYLRGTPDTPTGIL